jgi:hypothetical protein
VTPIPDEATVFSLDDTADVLRECHLVVEREFDVISMGRDPVYLEIHPLPVGRVRVRVTIDLLTEGGDVT